MFIISIILFTAVFANSYEKYIDLLPEEEKQVFLDHVARRVMESVDSKENGSKNSYSIELTKEQLKEHNDFVQSVLKQESEQMRRNKGGQLKTDIKYEELKVKALPDATDDKVASNTEDIAKQSYESEEANFTAITAGKTNGTVQKRSIPNDNESAEKAESKTEVHEVLISSKFNDLTAVKVTTKSALNNAGNIATVGITEALPARNSNESDSAIQTTTRKIETIDAYTSKSAVETQISTTVNFGSQKSEEDSDNDEDDNTKNEKDQIINTVITKEIIKTTTVKESKEITADIETTSNNSTLSTTLSDEGTKQATKIADNITLTNLPEIKPQETNEETTNKEEKVTTVLEHDNTTKKNNKIESTTVGKKTSTLKTTTNLPLDVLTPTNTHVTTKKPKKTKSNSSKIKKVINSNSNSTKTIHKSKKKIKEEEEKDFALIQKNIFTETLKKDQECGIQSCHRYRVYEVPEWPISAENSQPFLRSKEPMIDQPYFVPIYNYSPNYAYYNPENRRGPNAVEENSIEIDALREGDKTNTAEFEIDLDELTSKFSKFSKKTNHNKIAEILLKILKNNYKPTVVKTIKIENEEIVPLNKGKESLKTQIKRIRDVIYQNKHLKQSNRHKKEIDNDIKIKDLGNILDNIFRLTKLKHINKSKKPKNLNSDVLKYIFGNHNTVKVISLTPTAKFRTKHIKRPNKNKKNDEENKTVGREVNEMKNMVKKKKEELPKVQKTNDAKFNSYLNALKELIVQDSNALLQYDWLSTTVQIHGALSKLQELIHRVQHSETVHPADLQILKYAVFLHNFATEIRQANHYGSKRRNKLALPRNMKRKERFHVVKEKGLLNRVLLFLRNLMPNLNDQDELSNLNQFLMDVEDGLFDLHEALKNIAIVTKFKNQNWYRNLKDLYLSTDEKQLKEVLLHITFARLVDLIEFSCRNGLENGFVEFVKTHKTVAKRTLEEILFVLKIVDEIDNNLT